MRHESTSARGSNFAVILQGSTRRKHGYPSDNYRNDLIGTLARLRIVLLAIDPITNTVTVTITITITNAVANGGSGRFNRQRRTQLDDDRLRSQSNRRCRWRDSHVDERRHDHAHVDRRRRHMGLR